jgi:hypothetical protein
MLGYLTAGNRNGLLYEYTQATMAINIRTAFHTRKTVVSYRDPMRFLIFSIYLILAVVLGPGGLLNV